MFTTCCSLGGKKKSNSVFWGLFHFFKKTLIFTLLPYFLGSEASNLKSARIELGFDYSQNRQMKMFALWRETVFNVTGTCFMYSIVFYICVALTVISSFRSLFILNHTKIEMIAVCTTMSNTSLTSEFFHNGFLWGLLHAGLGDFCILSKAWKYIQKCVRRLKRTVRNIVHITVVRNSVWFLNREGWILHRNSNVNCFQHPLVSQVMILQIKAVKVVAAWYINKTYIFIVTN